MDENPVDNIGVVGNGNTNEKERNQEKKEICFFSSRSTIKSKTMDFDLIVDLE